MTGNALFLSISSQPLYETLERQIPESFPRHSFEFLGHTFADETPWRKGQKADLLPTSRLLWRWVLMNEFTAKYVAPALAQEGQELKLVFVREFGREAYHYAIRHCREYPCRETLQFHKGLVRERLLAQHISPPIYIAEHPTEERIIQADKEYFNDPNQELHYLHTDSLDAQFEETIELVRQLIACRTSKDTRMTA